MDELRVLTVKDIMRILNIGKDKAYALMHSQSFPSFQIGKTYLVTSVNLMKWIEEATGRSIVV